MIGACVAISLQGFGKRASIPSSLARQTGLPTARARSNDAASNGSPIDQAIAITDFSSLSIEPDPPTPLPFQRLLSLEERLRPFVVTATDVYNPEPNHRWKHRAQIIKERRAAPAIAQHDRLAARKHSVPIYTDGSVRGQYIGGCGAVIPSLGYAAISHLHVIDHPRRTVLAELHGVSLGMELAATYLPRGSDALIFTDSMMDRPLNREGWADVHLQRAYRRADAALRRLEERGTSVAVYWVPGHRGVIDGIILADRIAAYGSEVTPESMSRLLLAPVHSAGVAMDHVGVLSPPEGRHTFYIPPTPRRFKYNGLGVPPTPVDGLSPVNAYKGIREQFLSMSSESALAHRIASIALDSTGLEGRRWRSPEVVSTRVRRNRSC